MFLWKYFLVLSVLLALSLRVFVLCFLSTQVFADRVCQQHSKEQVAEA